MWHLWSISTLPQTHTDLLNGKELRRNHTRRFWMPPPWHWAREFGTQNLETRVCSSGFHFQMGSQRFRGPQDARAPRPVCPFPHTRRGPIYLSGSWAHVPSGLDVWQPCGVGRHTLGAQTNRWTTFAFKSQVPPARVTAGASEKKRTDWIGGSRVASLARSVPCKHHRGTRECQARLSTVSLPKLRNSSRSWLGREVPGFYLKLVFRSGGY